MRTGQGLAVVLCLLAAGRVAAQPAAQPAEQNDRLVRAEAPIVAGNAVSAKKRALADAFKQVVEHAFSEVIKEGDPLPQPWPAGVVQLKASLANAAQKFVRSYRIVEQSSEGGVLKVMVEADVDTGLLRREIDRARGAAVVAAPAQKSASVLLVAGGAGAAMASVLTAAGVPAQAVRAQTEAQLVAAAVKQNAHALFVGVADSDEGPVRGTLQVSAQCSLTAHLFMAGGPTGRPVLDQTDEDRGFGADSAAAREACVARTAAHLARAVVAKLRAPGMASSFVTVQLDIADPGAVAVVLQACKRIGSVTATEVRQVAAASAEIRVFTRMGGAAIQQALGRELAGKLAMVPIQSSNDTLGLRLRHPDTSTLEENQ
jgi:hypothetical protein